MGCLYCRAACSWQQALSVTCHRLVTSPINEVTQFCVTWVYSIDYDLILTALWNCTIIPQLTCFSYYDGIVDFSLTAGKKVSRTASASRLRLSEELLRAIEPLVKLQQETNTLVKSLQRQIVMLQEQNDLQIAQGNLEQYRHWFLLAVILLTQVLLQWLFKWGWRKKSE